MLGSTFYSMADTYFVSRLGTSATSAVGVVFALMAVLQAAGFFFGHGAGNFIARELGAENYGNASRMAALGFFSSLAAGILICLSGEIFLERLVILLGATDTNFPYAREYTRFILMGAPWLCASFTLNNLLRYQGSAFYGMIGILTGAALNVALTPLLLFVFNMGIKGAAIATVVSQFVGFIVLLRGCRRKGNISLDITLFAPSLMGYKEIARGGLPSLIRQSVAAIAAICMNRVAGGFGDEALAAIVIVQRVFFFAGACVIGIGQGFQPVCGWNYGAKLYGRVRESFIFALKVTTAFLVVAAVSGFVFAYEVVYFFRPDALVVEIGGKAMRFSCATAPLLGFVTLSNMMLQTIGKSAKASLLAVSRQGLALLPALYILSALLGVFGLQICTAAADLFTLAVALPLTLSEIRNLEGRRSAPKQISI